MKKRIPQAVQMALSEAMLQFIGRTQLFVQIWALTE